ncbi:MAG: response regulator transcription factor [Flavobacteriales bacterium]|nr:response regulator transcription factor [Flavobacteriales bacterium]
MSITAIIIDDEERARNTLSSLLKMDSPDIEILASCSNVPAGVLAINHYKPQLVFLDIEMPEYNGFELLKFFRDVDFEIIFVTAYSEYAIKAFEVSAIDYLLKPIDMDQLHLAIEKFKKKRSQTNIQQRIDLLKENLDHQEVRKIALPMNDGLLFVEVQDIIMLEAEGSYTHVFLRNGSKMLVSKKIGFFEDLLSNRTFIYRPHRSFLINLNHIKKYIKGEGSIVMDNTFVVSISRDKKTEFEARLKELKFSN